MKFAPFSYACPTEAAEAVRLCAEAAGAGLGARFIAGGQSLLPALAFRLDQPGTLIDIGRIGALHGVTLHEGRLMIGALTTHATLERDPLIARHAPMLAHAAAFIAHAAIRNRGTIGGSICNADPAAELPAVVVALGARLHLLGPGGARAIEAGRFFRGYYETAKAAEELLTSIEIPIAVAADRCIDRVAEGALEARIQPGVEEHLIAGLSQYINCSLQANLAFCEGACFIGAQNVHAAEILNGSEAAHNHV